MSRLQFVFEDIVPANCEIGQPMLAEEAGVQVCCHDASSGFDVLRHPAGDGAVTRTDFEATPAWPHTQLVQPADRDGVRDPREEGQPLALEVLWAVLGKIAMSLNCGASCGVRTGPLQQLFARSPDNQPCAWRSGESNYICGGLAG